MHWISGFRVHLCDAGLGHISEIFDGDAPHRPRGCIAQAWSVAEVLRAAAALGLLNTRAGESMAIAAAWKEAENSF